MLALITHVARLTNAVRQPAVWLSAIDLHRQPWKSYLTKCWPAYKSTPWFFCAKICPKFFELYASTYGSALVTGDLPGQGLQYTMFWSSSTKLTGLSTSSAHAALNCEKLKPRYGPPCMLRYLTDWQCTVFQLNRASVQRWYLRLETVSCLETVDADNFL